AGRAAYSLVLRPRDHRSTISEIRISIDAEHHIPLQVEVFAGGSAPAFQTGFTHISFSRPAGSVFDFTPPAGANVSKNPFADNQEHAGRPRSTDSGRAGDAHPAPSTSLAPKVIGSGWTTVVELAGSQANSLLAGTLGRLTTSAGTSGGRLLHTALINAVLLPDGRAFIGAVQPGALEAVAQSTSR
ncbi:MAG: hypothetical protein QOH17_30, partial [Pseudonocardiales bacterium]|nr:hypothetical protein [Pseudonocardiales bacterium]